METKRRSSSDVLYFPTPTSFKQITQLCLSKLERGVRRLLDVQVVDFPVCGFRFRFQRLDSSKEQKAFGLCFSDQVISEQKQGEC